MHEWRMSPRFWLDQVKGKRLLTWVGKTVIADLADVAIALTLDMLSLHAF